MNITSATPRPLPQAVKFDRKDGSYLLRKDVFQDAYVGQVEKTLGATPGSSVLKGACVATAYRVARQLLGPLQALALGGDAMASLVGEQDSRDLDEGMRNKMQAHQVGQVPGTSHGIYLGDQDGVGYGASTSQSVVLPEGFASLLPHPIGAFLVGHELGHVEHNDVVRRFGRQQIESSLRGSELSGEVSSLAIHLDHEAEFAADARGAEYALEQGHAGPKVLESFSRFLNVTHSEASDSHPGTQARLERLAEKLK